jgi:antitoxin component HigA of HigAB toxin-antitoxin module
MNISRIKTLRDYRYVLKEIEGLMFAKHNTPEGDRLDVLVTLVETWERELACRCQDVCPDHVRAVRAPGARCKLKEHRQ